MASLGVIQQGDLPSDIWVVVLDDFGVPIDPSGLVVELGFTTTSQWTTFQAEIVPEPLSGFPCIHLVIPPDFRANLVNREFRLRPRINGTDYGPWSARLAF